MWIDRTVFNELVDAHARGDASRDQVALLTQQLALAQRNFEWLTVRVTQLEAERAALLERQTGVRVSVPHVSVPGGGPPRPVGDADDFLARLPALFEDAGDEPALPVGASL
jgi:hypothetical protein